MKFKRISIGVVFVSGMFVFGALSSVANAQGRPANAGPPAGVPAGPPAGNPGVDRGIGTASVRSGGRSDTGLGTASARSNGRSDTGIDRARLARMNAAAVNGRDLDRYYGLSQRFGNSPDEMRMAFQTALLANPDLTFGQFVAASVLADNLNSRFPSVTSSAILAGLANGDNLGRTLRNLGVGRDDAEHAERSVKERMKAAKKNKN